MFGHLALFHVLFYFFHLTLAVPNPVARVFSRDLAANDGLSSTTRTIFTRDQDPENKCATTESSPTAHDLEAALKMLDFQTLYIFRSRGCHSITTYDTAEIRFCLNKGEVEITGRDAEPIVSKLWNGCGNTINGDRRIGGKRRYRDNGYFQIYCPKSDGCLSPKT